MTNSDLPVFKTGDRIECASYYGTIKYIGTVDGKPSLWLGIDWDDPERGKHNGTVNGIQYFLARHKKSGSFVRPEKVELGKSAVASIISRYGENEDEFTSKINQQKQLRVQQIMNAPFIEMVGFDKIFDKQSDFTALKIVNLRQQNICSAGGSMELARTCPNIEELDLSKNLFSSWRDIFEICEQLPNLHWLNVGENLMVVPENFANFNFPRVKVLICGSMELNWCDVLKISACFPGIEEFRAPNNKICFLSPVGNCFQNLEMLDLEGNSIVEWSEVCKLGDAPKLQQLVVENIGLKSIKFEEPGPKVAVFRNVRKLCLVNNLIEEWQSVGELNRLERLDNLKFLKNPVLETEDNETVHQLIIAKIENLKVLNGADIEPGERRGAEYDYIKKYGLEWLQVKGTENEKEFLKLRTRYLELIQKYGEPEETELTVQSKVIKDSLLELKLVCGSRTLKKKIPPTMTIQKLELLTQKLFRLNDRPTLTYISGEDAYIRISLNDEMKEIGLYSVQDGDQIIVNA